MKVLTCASYYGSGSSAVIDYAREFDGLTPFLDDEFRILHDPDGIDDLYYHLVENHNRHNSGHAIKRFVRLGEHLSGNWLVPRYRAMFGDAWEESVRGYVASLVDFTYHGWWNFDLYDRGGFFYLRKRLPNWILRRTLWRNQPERTLNTMRDEITYCAAPSHEEFVRATREFLARLFQAVGCDASSTVLLDQAVPSSHIERYLSYFDDLRVVVVDRDPRDVYTLERMVWRDGVIPADDAEVFARWFRYTRHDAGSGAGSSPATRLMFEDLVYRYEETTALVNATYGLRPADHRWQYRYFDPSRSMRNTRTWLAYPDISEEIRVIERLLPEYLYKYD